MTSTNNMTRTGAEILVSGLVEYGVDTFFCVPGESYLAVLDTVYDYQENLQVITCRQEGGVAYMAEAYGKLTAEPGVCFVSRGPGASNAMIGIHTAAQDSTPLLMFVGDIPKDDVGREAFQDLDYHRVYGSIAKKVITINDAARIPEQLQQAWHTATSGRPGPVVVSLPEDMLLEKAAVENLPKPILTPAAPAPQSIDLLFKWLDKAERPLIVCGGAGWSPRTSELLTTFSETHTIAVTTAFRRSSSFDNSHPHYAGDLGIQLNPELERLIQTSDLILVIAARLGDVTTSGYTLFDVPGGISKRSDQKLVHVSISAEELNSVYTADLGIVSHPELFLETACNVGTPADSPHQHQSSRAAFVRSAHQHYLAYLTEPREAGKALRMDRVAEILREKLPSNTIITNGAGNYATWAQRHYVFTDYHSQVASTNGSMGYGIPAAVTAKLLYPERTVVSFAGDGCFLMNGQELATAMQYNLNIIILIVNNSGYGTIKSYQERQFPGRPVATALKNPDFALLAQAYGAFGATVERTEDFEAVFEQAINYGTCAVIELKINNL